MKNNCLIFELESNNGLTHTCDGLLVLNKSKLKLTKELEIRSGCSAPQMKAKSLFGNFFKGWTKNNYLVFELESNNGLTHTCDGLLVLNV